MTTKFYKNKKYDVLTDKGFKHFDGLQVSITKDMVMVTTTAGHFYATKDHNIYYTATDKKPISEYAVGDTMYSVNGDVKITRLLDIEIIMKAYDLIEVEDGHSFLICDSGIKSSNCAYIDEAAFIDGFDEFYASTYPVVSSGQSSKIIITSTPNGVNYFHKIWHEALAVPKKNTFTAYKVKWQEHPDRDQKWYENTLKSLSPEKFAVEYESLAYDTLLNIKIDNNYNDVTIGELFEDL